jgi:hypothetical protein
VAIRLPSMETTADWTSTKAITREREAALGSWIGSSVERLRQLTGEPRSAQPRVMIESIWAALGDRAAPVTIVRWREESRADLVA